MSLDTAPLQCSNLSQGIAVLTPGESGVQAEGLQDRFGVFIQINMSVSHSLNQPRQCASARRDAMETRTELLVS